MHYFEFNIKSYQAATSHLTNEEDLAYRRLIEFYYDTEKPIPNALPDKPTALQWLSRRLRVAIPSLEIVLNEFFRETENGWVHEYCDRVLAEFKAYKERQRINGSKGGRGNKANANPSKPTALPEEPTAKPTTNQEPENQEPENQEPKKKKRASAPSCPPDVSQQVWNDWLALRKAKKAPVTETVISAANSEAQKAGMSLENFLRIWCARGSQGLQAEWLKPAELQSGRKKLQAENFAERDYGTGVMPL